MRLDIFRIILKSGLLPSRLWETVDIWVPVEANEDLQALRLPLLFKKMTEVCGYFVPNLLRNGVFREGTPAQETERGSIV